MNYPFTLLATTLLCSTLHAQTSTPPSAADGTPLVVGDLQLVFREGVDPAKLDALVADTRRRSSEMHAQGFRRRWPRILRKHRCHFIIVVSSRPL